MSPPQDVGDQQHKARRQAGDHKLVDGEHVLQRVDPLLHGAGVEVVVDAGADAPQRPQGVQHQRHGGGQTPSKTGAQHSVNKLLTDGDQE